MIIRKTLLILLLAVFAAGPALAGSWPHERDGFMLGFNIGAGSAGFNPDDDYAFGESESAGGGAGSFRLAWAFSNQFLVGLESTAWVGSTDYGGDLTLSSYKLNFTWYPSAKGWFLRGGFGGGSAEVSGDFAGLNISASKNGGSFGIGAGYEWRLTRTFALGTAIDYNTVGLDFGMYDFLNFTAQLNWYF